MNLTRGEIVELLKVATRREPRLERYFALSDEKLEKLIFYAPSGLRLGKVGYDMIKRTVETYEFNYEGRITPAEFLWINQNSKGPYYLHEKVNKPPKGVREPTTVTTHIMLTHAATAAYMNFNDGRPPV